MVDVASWSELREEDLKRENRELRADAERVSEELTRLRAEYASLQESVTAKDLLIASLKKFKEDVVKVFKDHGREFPGTIEHFDTDGITLRKDELTTYATLMFLFDEVDSLKEERATSELRLADLSAAHAFLTQQLAAANGRVERMWEIGAFLLGEGKLDGRSFGELVTDSHDGIYFWRKHLRSALSALPQQVKSEDERDGERYRHIRKSFESSNSATSDFGRDPKLVWYLPQWDRNLPWAERLDAAIDAAIAISAQEEKDS